MAKTKSEDILGEKWDRCVSDTIVKMGGGLGVGVLFSVLFFKRRSWPIVFGLGSGFGMGYANCQHLFDQPYLVRPERITVTAKSVTESVEGAKEKQ
ncbi:MICOS complex subunit Mic10 [Hyalella azteca]|uniref:MICOS complex subunit MIC10 n=1 Tax=Hyalella azteca TaxID=294128 RepID=A0A8B7N9H3_HYAAZ|nr:MICOS complex subunit Mic10 [Hyalella azteca]